MHAEVIRQTVSGAAAEVVNDVDVVNVEEPVKPVLEPVISAEVGSKELVMQVLLDADTN